MADCLDWSLGPRKTLPDEKWDHTLACNDYNVFGEGCPHHDGWKHQCRFFGRDKPTPLPSCGVCDKTPEMLVPSKAALLSGDLTPKDLSHVTGSREYHLWLLAYNHYKLDPAKRRVEEDRLLHGHARDKSYADISRRDWKRVAKPDDKYLRPVDPKSFRQRALFGMDRLMGWTKPEYVVLCPEHTKETVTNDDGTIDEYDYWTPGILSKSPAFRYEIDQSGVDAFEGYGLQEIMEQHEDKKILLRWAWWASTDYWGEHDSGIDYLELVRVL